MGRLAAFLPRLVALTVAWLLATAALTYAAAQHLSSLAKEDPCLSADGVIENAVENMLDKLRQLETRHRRPVRRA